MQNEINLNDKTQKIYQDTYLYFSQIFDTFDIDLLQIDVEENVSFEILFSYSFDKINYADFVLREDFEVIQPPTALPFYIAILFKKITHTDNVKILTLYQQKNVDEVLKFIEINSISYDSIEYDFTDYSVARFETINDTINSYPRFNYNDNQNIHITRWKKQCASNAETCGVTAIYFRATEKEVNNTLASITKKEVTDIKMLHVQCVDGAIPSEKIQYNDWDFAIPDEFIIHVVLSKFQHAFGAKTIPLEKDYLYLPFLGKMFQVATAAPQDEGRFMGQIAWWILNLKKYEEDSTVTISQDLIDEMQSIQGIDEICANFELSENNEEPSEIFNELIDIKSDTLITQEKISEATVDEKKKATNNFSNSLVDSTHYISLKETEILREFYNQRLNIVEINMETEPFPVNFYDNTTVQKRVIALSYSIENYTTKNKLSNVVSDSYQLNFDYVLRSKFSGEIIDVSNEQDFSFLTINNNRNKLQLINNLDVETFEANYLFEIDELYHIELTYNFALKQFALKIYKLLNSQSTLVYQNIYVSTTTNTNTFSINKIHLFGGAFLSSKIVLDINTKNIITDFVQPIMIMRNFNN